jgi:outer membrane protein assembly factor BamB
MKLNKMSRKCNYAFVAILFCVFLIVSAVLAPQVFAQTGAGSGNWSMYHHDAAHTGYSDTSAPTSASQLWKYSVDSAPVTLPASPAVVDGEVYVGSGDNNVYCFSETTGAKVWSYPTGSYASATPAVVDGRVFVGSADGYIYCLDAAGGSQIWNFSISQSNQLGGSSGISPTVSEGYVYVESEQGNVYCLNASDGSNVWNYTTSANALNASPAVDGGYVYVGNNHGDVYCLNAADGSEIWNFTTGGAVRSPAAANGYVYVGSADGNAYCLRASDGIKVWNYTTEYNSNGPAHGYYWGNAVSDPAVAGGFVYVGSSDFMVYCLDAASGSKIWNFTTKAEVYSAPAVAAGLVFAGSYDGNAYCLNASDGSQVWSYQAGVFSPVDAAGSASSPVIADGFVYVVGNGVLYALGTPSTVTTSPSYENLIIFAAVFIVIVVILAAVLFRRRLGKPLNTVF